MRSYRRRKFYAFTVLVLVACLLIGCRTENNLPKKPSKEYNEAVRTFYVGLAALQVGHDIQADAKLAQLTQTVPAEPAGWANWGVLALRQRNYDSAAERFEKARTLAPENDQINYLIGLLESSRGKQAEAIAALRKAVELNPQNLIAAYQLAGEVERQADPNSEAEFQKLITQILQAQPRNLAALLELARIVAKRGDANTLRDTIAKISNESSTWPDEVKQQLTAVQAAAIGSDPSATATRIVFLRNVLVRVPQYRQDLSELKPPPGEEATPFTHFVKLETPTFNPAPADTGISFKSESIPEFSAKTWNWVGAVYLGITGAPSTIVADTHEVRTSDGATMAFPAGSGGVGPTIDGVLTIDFTYDFKTDLVLAGEGGVRLMRQDDPKHYTDVTSAAKLPATITSGKYHGAWAADIEADGDLDIVLGTNEGNPPVLRNNGDGTFLELHPFNKVTGARGFAWADFDADGDPDAALIDAAGKLHVFSNQRQGQFAERQLPTLPAIKAISVADINNDGQLDLVAIQTDGLIIRLSDKDEGAAWDTGTLANLQDTGVPFGNELRLRIADVDNNGGLDLLVASPSEIAKSLNCALFLSDENSHFKYLELPGAVSRLFDTIDLNNDGRLDLIGLAGDGHAIRSLNESTKNYHWQVVRPHASQATGDQRINPFGVGGEMEIRAGLMLQKQPITGPVLHFGLGEQTGADVVRVVWPNGTVRAEFDVKGDQEIVTEQESEIQLMQLWRQQRKAHHDGPSRGQRVDGRKEQ